MAVNIKIRARRLLNPLIHYHSWEDSEPKEITSLLPLAKRGQARIIYYAGLILVPQRKRDKNNLMNPPDFNSSLAPFIPLLILL